MTLVLSPPEWKASSKYYDIKFSWDPTANIGILSDTCLDTTVAQPILEDDSAKKAINTIIESLLEQGKRWFAKPLTENMIRNRLKHEFSQGTEGNIPEPPFQVEWIPTSIRISTSQFVLVWSFKSFKELKTQIPSSFLDDETDDTGLKEVDLEKSVVTAGGDLFTLKENEEKRLSKERVKAARIKAAVAKYKAEVLIQEYEELYGDLSDISDEEEEEEDFGEDD